MRGKPEKQKEIMRLHEKRVFAIRAENRDFIPAARAKPGVVGVISDNLGLNGLLNHADGKHYDSKSEFRKATRKAGCFEVGNDVKARDVAWKPPVERGIRGDFNVSPALKEAVQRAKGV